MPRASSLSSFSRCLPVLAGLSLTPWAVPAWAQDTALEQSLAEPSAAASDEDLATPTETMVDENKPVPKADNFASFQGLWSGLQDVCGDSRAVLELTVAPDKLIFHESVGTVQSVTPRSDGTIAVEAAFTGEGQSWTRTLALRGSDDGQRLTIVHDGVAITRKRC